MEPDKSTLDHLRALMGEEFTSIVRLFLRNTDALLVRLAANPQAVENTAEFVREVHALKSSSRYMGGEHLGDAADLLESAARACLNGEGDVVEVARRVAALQVSWQAIRPAYQAEADKNSAGAA